MCYQAYSGVVGLYPQVQRPLHALVCLHLLRLLEGPMRGRHLHLRAVEQLLDCEDHG